jgi:acetolactate synthase-1/2/3 large subunit
MAMSGLELLTAVRERLPIVVLVFNDGQLNRIRLQQLSQFGQPVAVELLNPDFEELAHSLGARYERIGADAEGAFARALAASEVTVLELVLGDAPGLLRERAKGLARGAARRAMGEGGLRRVVSRLLGRGRRRRF